MILTLFLSLICHFIGDYLLQNDWMAQNKTKLWLPAFIHALIYSFLFYFLVPSAWWLVIFLTHLLIDRFRLAIYWIQLVNGTWGDFSNFGYKKDKPVWMSVWLMIIVDNTIHVLINTAVVLAYYNFK